MATLADIEVGQKAARAWLDANEGAFSSMISDDIIIAVVREVLNAVSAADDPLPTKKSSPL